MQSDLMRAGSLLVATAVLAGGAVWASPHLGLAATDLPREQRLYSILNITEDPSVWAACPLDQSALRSRIESRLAANNLDAVYSPIADGPDVMMHEAEARMADDQDCDWTIRVNYQGNSHTLVR
ncbi:MAG: hypothetical protein VX501_00280 [Pseudomonadota bacterium]|nr:hypothetical protein [Pseudomonadota bacterium]